MGSLRCFRRSMSSDFLALITRIQQCLRIYKICATGRTSDVSTWWPSKLRALNARMREADAIVQ